MIIVFFFSISVTWGQYKGNELCGYCAVQVGNFPKNIVANNTFCILLLLISQKNTTFALANSKS